MGGVFRLGVLVAILAGVGLAAAPTASGHRLDLKAAKEIADRLSWDEVTGVTCRRRTDHRVTCEWEFELIDDEGGFDYADSDLVLVGSRLYECDVGRPCTKRKKPITLLGRFAGRTSTGRADIDLETAARGVGGYFVPFAFDAFDVPIRAKCSDGSVRKTSLSLMGHIRGGRIHARQWLTSDYEEAGPSRSFSRLTGFATRNRLSALAEVTDYFRNGTTCYGKQRLALRPAWEMPHYIE